MKKVLLIALTMLMTLQLFAQNIVATGTIKNIDGVMLVGVSVEEKGVTNSTLTDADGNFRLSLSNGRVLVVKMKGYETQEVEVGDDGKVPDIILLKAKRRFRIGVMAGVDYGGAIAGNDYSNYHELKSSPSSGYNFGLFFSLKRKQPKKLKKTELMKLEKWGKYVKLKKWERWTYEFGFIVYTKDEYYSEYDANAKVTYLNIPFLINTWRPKVNKGFLLTGGVSVNVLLKGSVNLPDGEYQFGRWGYGGNYGLGYDFSFGFGIRLVGNVNFFAFQKDEKILNRIDYMGNCVLTYRF